MIMMMALTVMDFMKNKNKIHYEKITKLVCVAMALVILVCFTNGATASAAKRIYFASEYRCKLGPGEYYVLQLISIQARMEKM